MIPQVLFSKNIAVVGLLTLAAWGAGAWSLDGRRKRVRGRLQSEWNHEITVNDTDGLFT